MAEVTKVEPEQEVTADDLVTQPDSDAGQAAPPPEKEKGHEFDKVRQQVQQEIGNKVRPLEAKIDSLLAKIEAQGGQATPSQQREAERLIAAKDELDEFETTDPTGLGVLAKRLKKYESDSKSQREVWEKRVAEAEASAEQARQASYPYQWKTEWARIHPDLKDKADEAFSLYSDEYGKLVEPGESLPPATAKRLATVAYQAALAKVKPAETPATEEPAKTEPPAKSTRGTQIASGSSARRTVDNRKEPTDDELIDGFFNDPNA